MTPKCDVAVSFLEQLRPGGSWDLVAFDPEKRAPAKHGRFDDQAAVAAAVEQWNGELGLNMYVGLNPIRDGVPPKVKYAREDVGELAVLHVDLDPRAGEDFDEERVAIVQRLRAKIDEGDIPEPTWVIDSGGGYWAIWLLEEPVALDGSEKVYEDAKLWNLALERLLGADNCHNIDRIARLPGTVNYPDANKRKRGRVAALSSVLKYTGERRRLDEFEKASPGAPLTASTLAPPGSAVRAGEATYTSEVYRSGVVSPLVDLDVPARARDIALNGETEHDRPEDTSRSGWLFSMLTTCTRAGVDQGVLTSLVRSPDLHESLQAHIRENGDERYVVAQIRKAYEKAPCVVAENKSVAMSEDDFALRFARFHKDDLRYCAQRGLWFKWDDTRWRPEETLLAWDLVKEILREAAKYVDPDKPQKKQGLLSKSKIAAVEHLARSDRRMAVTLDQFDADPMLLNTPDGVVDLSSGEVTPSSPELYCTKQTAVEPVSGEPRKFLDFLRWACGGDQAFVDYVQRIMGYCLTGETKEHALFFVHGPGGNGKSVLQEILQWLLNDYATSTTFDTLALNQGGAQHPTDLAGMKGARLVVAPETEANQRWAEAKIKRMTGGDRIAARFMRQDFFEYTPQFKLFVVGNHKPGFQNVDHAIRRRIHLLPFNQEIAADQMDRDLCEKLKRDEGGRILSWAIDGALAWADQGLAPPKIITGATDEYLEDEDMLGLWLGDCTVDDGEFTDLSTLYKSYRAFTVLAGERAMAQKRFGSQLTDRGWPPHRGTGGTRQRQMALSPEGLAVITEVTGERDHYPEKF